MSWYETRQSSQTGSMGHAPYCYCFRDKSEDMLYNFYGSKSTLGQGEVDAWTTLQGYRKLPGLDEM